MTTNWKCEVAAEQAAARHGESDFPNRYCSMEILRSGENQTTRDYLLGTLF
jgi:hypothetical protein